MAFQANMWSGCAYFFIISASGVRYRWWSALALMLQMDVVGSVLLVKEDHLFGREVFFQVQVDPPDLDNAAPFLVTSESSMTRFESAAFQM